MKTRQIIIFVATILATAMIVLGFVMTCNKLKDRGQDIATDTIQTIVNQAQRCSRLYTAEYRVHKIVTHSDDVRLDGKLFQHDISLRLPIGQRKVAIPIDATVKAYIDMSALTSDDVTQQGRNIEIRLPQPQVIITSSSIDHDGIKQHVALLRHNFSDEELAAYERLGRKAIENSLKDMDIKETARRGAAQVLIPMIEQMGFDEAHINITFDDNSYENILNNSDMERQGVKN